jgi:hypothetical protein
MSVDDVSQSDDVGDGAHGSATSDVASALRVAKVLRFCQLSIPSYCHKVDSQVHRSDVFSPRRRARQEDVSCTRCSMVAPSE